MQQNDTFVQYVDGKQTSQGIRIGSSGADIDIYSIKVYKKALTANDVRQNYMASLDNSEEKIAFRDSNNILDGNTISYDLAYEKYNVILWKGKYATYGNTKKDKFNGTLIIHIPGEPENSGTLYDMNEKVKEPHPCCIGGGMDNGASMKMDIGLMKME